VRHVDSLEVTEHPDTEAAGHSDLFLIYSGIHKIELIPPPV
jgi:hypothetical protein